MRRMAVLVLVLLVMVTLSTPAFAGGPPPKNFKKGVFLEIDKSTGVGLFQPSDSTTPMTVRLGEDVSVDDVALNSKVMMTFAENDGQVIVTWAVYQMVTSVITQGLATEDFVEYTGQIVFAAGERSQV